MKFKEKDIAESRQKALESIKAFLEVEDIENQFKDRDKGHWSKGKFVVTWKMNFRGIPCEGRLDLMDPFYTAYSGYKTARVSVGLFHEKQIEGYRSVYEGLIKTGIYLCHGREAMREFFDKYVPAYNQKIEETRQNEMLIREIIGIIRGAGTISTAQVQKGLDLGYTRANELMKIMEDRGMIGPGASGTTPREILKL